MLVTICQVHHFLMENIKCDTRPDTTQYKPCSVLVGKSNYFISLIKHGRGRLYEARLA